MHHHGVTFNLGSARVCSLAILKTYFSYNKDIWIAVELSCFNTLSLHAFSFSSSLLFLFKNHPDVYITDAALKVSQSL